MYSRGPVDIFLTLEELSKIGLSVEHIFFGAAAGEREM